ncbi:hypothetical protein GQ600_21932 [Phytophthora cactorum]|nr:hypothetical protein GQ600_21932 [Phytophthora cactorum]
MIFPVKCLMASALVASCAHGHGFLTKPAATYDPQMDKSQYVATIESSTSGLKGTFTGAPADNVASFAKAFKASKYKSIKEFIDDKAKITVTGATLTCGIADPDTTPQALPAKWSGHTPIRKASQLHMKAHARSGATRSECSRMTTVLPTTLLPLLNCRTRRASAGCYVLTMYWMAMHGPSWQVYVNCAPLSGGSGGGATTESSGSSATTTDSSTPESSTAQTLSSGGLRRLRLRILPRLTRRR